MAAPQPNQFYREYNLVDARKNPPLKMPASHQAQALASLSAWFARQSAEPKGAMLVLPTGGGKTFTAVRFLCHHPLAQGYKVLWLAHTHHLLEQALESVQRDVGQITEPKKKLCVRVVSGTIGHNRVHDIKPTDDLLICTLQTVTQAYRNNHRQFQDFLRAAGDKLCVVFDEAHHAPAYSYRTLLHNLRARHPHMLLLGLTATPTYSDAHKQGWLHQLFPQGILHQVTPQELMAARVLAKPIFEEHRTNFDTEFDERQYQQWRSTYRDIPEDIITQLAQSRERNLFIAERYAANREAYGKTIIFADRWFQCDQLREFLRERGVRADVIYTHIDADPGGVEARNKRAKDENHTILAAFHRNELDVLINVRMLTEGTDVPQVKTVFLTRQTTSGIMLTQMIGRALRGPLFGGTEQAFIVSFIDNWKHLVNWADYTQLEVVPPEDEQVARAPRPPVPYVSINLVRHLVAQQNRTQVATKPFLTLLPLGWYRVAFTAASGEGDDEQTIDDLIMVFEHEDTCYKQFIQCLLISDLQAFAEPDVHLEDQREQIAAWKEQFFADVQQSVGSDLETSLFTVVRHVAHNGVAPTFFVFEERGNHDLDAVAWQFIHEDLSSRKIHASLQVEYVRSDRYWSLLYPSYSLFKTHYDVCENIILQKGTFVPETTPHLTEFHTPREPSEPVKKQVKNRDKCCLCCGENNPKQLQIDHVAPSYLGGSSAFENLQTLCKICNNHKGGINEINFRVSRNVQAPRPMSFPELAVPGINAVGTAAEWEKFLRRSINFFYRCAAVHEITIGQRGAHFYHWSVDLCEGNDVQVLEPHLATLLARIQHARKVQRYAGPHSMMITAPNQRAVHYPEVS